MNYAQHLHTALDKEAENVSVLAHLSESKLETKLSLVRKQMGSARRFEQHDALELLKIWEEQIFNALELKAQLNIEENEQTDLDMMLPELAAFEMIEKRQEILRTKLLKDDYIKTGL